MDISVTLSDESLYQPLRGIDGRGIEEALKICQLYLNLVTCDIRTHHLRQ